MKLYIFYTILFTFFINTYAQWQLNGVPVCDTVGRQHIAVNGILSDGQGGSFVVWGDNRDNWDIYAQRVDSSGRMLWGKQGKPICVYPGWQFAPVVTSDGEGGFVTAWGDTRNDTRDVYAQRVDNYGNILWDVDGLDVVQYEQFQGVSDILLAADSTFIIVWEDGRFFPDSSSIGIQKISKEGVKLWKEDGVRVSNNTGSPKLVSDENGGCFVIWAGNNSDGILVQHVDKKGNRLWDMPGKLASVGNADWGNTEFSVISNGFSGAYIAWDFYDTKQCYIQQIDSLGNRLWGDNGILLDLGGNIFHPKVKLISKDSICCVWQHESVFYQIFLQNGLPVFKNKKKLTNYIASRYLSFVLDNNKNLLLSNPEIINYFPNEFIVKAQKANTTGNLLWGSDGVVVSNQKISPNVVRGFSASDGDGGIITAWDDNRNDTTGTGITDIFIQRIYKDGKAGGDTATAILKQKNLIPENFKIKLYPNPFNNSVTIEFNLKRNKHVSLSIFNILGKLVWSIDTNSHSGLNRFAWNGINTNGKEVSSGIYIVSLSGKDTHALRKVLFLK